MTLNADNLDDATLETTLSVLLKHESDLERARRQLFSSAADRKRGDGPDIRPFQN